MTRTILVTGGTGQVGHALQALEWPEDMILHAPVRAELDLADPRSIERAFAGQRYAAVINAGAYTAVDKAEGAVVEAFAANAMGPAALAAASAAVGIPIIHVSTDYVFDGSADGFYAEEAPVAPLGVYGASKLAGELAVVSGNPRHVILRTAWVVSAHGANFVKTMLRLGAINPMVRVVDDQHGCPTSASDIAVALRAIMMRSIDDPLARTGIFHFVNAGEATWHDLAAEVFARAAARGGRVPRLIPIATADYPTPARRPANSRLSAHRIEREWGIQPRPWQAAVADIVAGLVPLVPVSPDQGIHA